jgi:hypothetical protein
VSCRLVGVSSSADPFLRIRCKQCVEVQVARGGDGEGFLRGGKEFCLLDVGRGVSGPSGGKEEGLCWFFVFGRLVYRVVGLDDGGGAAKPWS